MFARNACRTNGVIELTGDSLFDSQASPTNAYTALRVTAAGRVEKKEGTGGAWTDICGATAANAATLEVYMAVNSGSFDSGTTGSWVAASTVPTWVCQRTSDLAGSDTANGTLSMRHTGMASALASATYGFEAEVGV